MQKRFYPTFSVFEISLDSDGSNQRIRNTKLKLIGLKFKSSIVLKYFNIAS